MSWVTVSWVATASSSTTLAGLEKAIFRALMAAGRGLLVKAFRALEEKVLADGAGAKQRRRRRYSYADRACPRRL